jgi:hypothetical protein
MLTVTVKISRELSNIIKWLRFRRGIATGFEFFTGSFEFIVKSSCFTRLMQERSRFIFFIGDFLQVALNSNRSLSVQCLKDRDSGLEELESDSNLSPCFGAGAPDIKIF